MDETPDSHLLDYAVELHRMTERSGISSRDQVKLAAGLGLAIGALRVVMKETSDLRRQIEASGDDTPRTE